MSTSGVIAYKTDKGELRGTYVHDDTHPCLAIRYINRRIKRFGVEGLVKWIEAGVSAGGYWDFNSDNPMRHAPPLNEKIDAHEYGYLLTAFDEVQLVHKDSPSSHCAECSELMPSIRPQM